MVPAVVWLAVTIALARGSPGVPCPRPWSNHTGVCVPVDQCFEAVEATYKGRPCPTLTCYHLHGVRHVCCSAAVKRAEEACQTYRKKLVQPRGSRYIWNGEDALSGEFPHMAALQYRKNQKLTNNYACGGTIISEHFVLTAAHCFQIPFMGDPVEIRVGDLDLISDADNENARRYTVLECIPHPGYNPPEVYHDIGLIRVKGRILFASSEVFPACLPVDDDLTKEMAVWATGWGRTSDSTPLEKMTHRVLQKGQLYIKDQDECRQKYKEEEEKKTVTDKLPLGVIDSMVCAGDAANASSAEIVDTCPGDSGGPLQYKRKSMHYVIAVTSWGQTCPSSTPGLYTRVSSYVDWIANTVWP